jgi:hypothetical protein
LCRLRYEAQLRRLTNGFFEGQSVPLTKQNLQQRGSLAVISRVELSNPPAAWKATELRHPNAR